MKTVPQASSFDLAYCPDPTCGVHMTLLDENDEPICLASFTDEGALKLIEALRGLLYSRAVNKEDE